MAIKFGDGTGTVLAALRGFNCNVLANELGVADANYFRIGAPSDERIHMLHAAVAASAQFEFFALKETVKQLVEEP